MKQSKSSTYIASFMAGLGSILNIAPVFADVGNVGAPLDDRNNLKKDWQNVGTYLYKAMETLSNEQPKQRTRRS